MGCDVLEVVLREGEGGRADAADAHREGNGNGNGNMGGRTALPVANFFSVATMPPLRCAAFKALLPRTTVSRGPAAPPRVFDPILVTVSQSLILAVCVVLCCVVSGGMELLRTRCRRRGEVLGTRCVLSVAGYCAGADV